MNASERTYAITGATGHIGARVARGLLQAGHRVRAIGRDRARLGSLVELGAVACVGDVRDVGFVEDAFRGADVALLTVTADRASRDFRRSFGDVGANFATAARTAGIKAAVFISAQGAHDERYRGFLLIHNDVERSLNAVPNLDVLHLRAPFFFENLFYFLPATRARGALTSPISPDTQLDMGGTHDIAQAALKSLLELQFKGKSTFELRGPELLTMRAISGVIAKELGRPFGVEQMAREPDVEAIVGAGMSRDFANMMNDTWEIFNRHGLLRAEEPGANRMPTRIEAFVREELVPALRDERVSALR